MKYAGAEWVKASLKVDPSQFGEKVADLLGQMYLGIYHIPVHQLKKVQWKNTSRITITVGEDFATFDNNMLTRFVFLCHEMCIRGEISAATHGYLMLVFWPREPGATDMWRRHPSIDAHIETLREAYK